MIGSGNVATHLAKAIYKAGVEIKYVYSPTLANCSALANQVNATTVDNIDCISDVDLIVIAIKDNAIKGVVERLRDKDSIVVHTSGGINIDVFDGCVTKCGVIYPLQTFSKEREIDFKKVPLFIEANSTSVFTELEEFAKRLSESVIEADSRRRKIMHIAAVFACNFVNHCYDISSQILEKEGLNFSTLIPLIEETTKKISEITPHEAQTGPARRGDSIVMNSHLEMIDSPQIKEIY
ncbi:MAG: DUF2520 domain-containing protein [Bacteroidaceae bacterium]|nr:DUF2520 domain-containing protein [Bacteroidaceae bacterium]